MFDQDKADNAINFIRSLKHTKGKWKGVPFTMLPWQQEGLSDVFGNVNEEGFRQYKTSYWEIPKKNGKSEIGAGVGLKLLCADNEYAAEVYGCASDRAQASIVFDVAMAMVDMNPTLKKHIRPIPSQKRLVYLPTQSFYQVLSAEAYSKHGFNVHGVIFDEIHSLPSRDFYDVMTEGSGDARSQPLFFLITTAGNDPDRNSIGWELHQKAVDILTGVKFDPTFYPMVYGFDRDNKMLYTGKSYEHIDVDLIDPKEYKEYWSNIEVVRKVNPSLGHTIPEQVVKEALVSIEGNYARERNFRWLRLNSWEKIKAKKFLSLDFWDLRKKKIDKQRLFGRKCYGGLDLSTKIDLTAFVLLFPPDEINRQWIVLPFFWVPEERIYERSEIDGVPYDEWNEKGLLKATPGNVIDYDIMEEDILDICKLYEVEEIGYDPHNAIRTIIKFQEEGLVCAEVRQNFTMLSDPTKEIQKLVMSKKDEIAHDGHEVMRWNVGNTEIITDKNENIRPIKGPKTERIDGMVALINAMARAMLHVDTKSVYEERGVR